MNVGEDDSDPKPAEPAASGRPASVRGRRVRAENVTIFPYAHPASNTFRVRLDLPAGPGPHPAVVLVHGSGADAATIGTSSRGSPPVVFLAKPYCLGALVDAVEEAVGLREKDH